MKDNCEENIALTLIVKNGFYIELEVNCTALYDFIEYFILFPDREDFIDAYNKKFLLAKNAINKNN